MREEQVPRSRVVQQEESYWVPFKEGVVYCFRMVVQAIMSIWWTVLYIGDLILYPIKENCLRCCDNHRRRREPYLDPAYSTFADEEEYAFF